MRNKRRITSSIALVGAALALGFALSQNQTDTIVVMGSTDFDPSTPSGAYLQAVARLYEQQNPGVKIQLDHGSWADLWKKVGVMLGNRQGPDLLVGPRDYLMANGRGAGQWEDILVVPENRFLDATQRRALGATLLESTRFPGRGHMVWPWKVYIDGTMVVNGAMLREAGMNPATIQQRGWTMADFQRVAKAVTKGNQFAMTYGPMGGHNGERVFRTGLDTRKVAYRLQPHGFNTATYIDIKDGRLFFDSQGFLAGCNAIAQMLREKTVPQNTVGISFDESREAFIQGRTAFSYDGPDLINLVEERNRKIANGQERGTPVDAWVVPRPTIGGADFQPYPIVALSYGYYSFKQNPYKGDAHTNRVFEFAKFFTDPVFQVRLAADNTTPPDARVYMGEQSWFPGMMGQGANSKYVESLRNVWLPRMGIYLSMATTPDLQAALSKFDREVVQAQRDAVALGRTTCARANSAINTGLAAVVKAVPQNRRLTADAAKLAKEMDDFAAQVGQPR